MKKWENLTDKQKIEVLKLRIEEPRIFSIMPIVVALLLSISIINLVLIVNTSLVVADVVQQTNIQISPATSQLISYYWSNGSVIASKVLIFGMAVNILLAGLVTYRWIRWKLRKDEFVKSIRSD